MAELPFPAPTHNDPWSCAWCGEHAPGERFEGVERQHRALASGAQTYIRCTNCASLTAAAPFCGDLSAHYPNEYYSFAPIRDARWRRAIRGARVRALLPGDSSILGRVVARVIGIPPDLDAVRYAVAATTDSILDVGSGAGRLLHDLSYAGLRNLVGVDPFGPELDAPVRLTRTWPAPDARFDLCMSHHSIEHVESPSEVFGRVRECLKPNGRFLVRAPVADSRAALDYGSHWVQLDAPRHRSIPTSRGMHILAKRFGFRVQREWRDSSAFQFWGSEGYRRGLYLESFHRRPSAYFTAREMGAWREQALESNASGSGDQAAWILARGPY
jgi:SAM-dependent methyltransferase